MPRTYGPGTPHPTLVDCLADMVQRRERNLSRWGMDATEGKLLLTELRGLVDEAMSRRLPAADEDDGGFVVGARVAA